jgi:hypothetical protein
VKSCIQSFEQIGQRPVSVFFEAQLETQERISQALMGGGLLTFFPPTKFKTKAIQTGSPKV